MFEIKKTARLCKLLFTEALKLKETQDRDNIESAKLSNFNLELYLKVIPEFSGNYKELHSFLTIIELIYAGLATVHQLTLICFIINVKLTQSVRIALRNTEGQTFSELKSLLINRYKNTDTVA